MERWGRKHYMSLEYLKVPESKEVLTNKPTKQNTMAGGWQRHRSQLKELLQARIGVI